MERDSVAAMPADQSKEIRFIFKRYKNKVYGLGLAMTRDANAAEDIVQNTFLKALAHIKKFRREASLSTWIYRIAHNEALQYLRRKRRDLNLYGLFEQSGRQAENLYKLQLKLPDRELLDKELKERLEAILNDMPIQYRIPVLLSADEELSIRDIAEILRIKSNTVKTRIHRGRAIIRLKISDYFRDKEFRATKKRKSCGMPLKFIYDYTDGILPKPEMRSFDRHISDCSSCKDFLSNYARALRITKALQCQDMPEDLQTKIEDFLAVTTPTA